MTFKQKLILVLMLIVPTVAYATASRQLKAQTILNGAGVLTLPTSTDTLVGRATTDTLTNKTLTGNTAVNLISGSGTLTLNTSGTATIPNATDTLVGKATTDTLTNKSISGATNTLTAIPLTTAVTGTLPVDNGGTGAATLTANNVLLGNGTSAVQFVAPSTSGNVLTSNGTTWTSAAAAGGSVASSGTVRINSARITNTGTCTITSQDGAWLSSVSTPATGRCTLNFAGGTFSAAPNCVATNIAGALYATVFTAATTSAVTINTITDAGAEADGSFYVICIGAQ